jgi:hypothetical protein
MTRNWWVFSLLLIVDYYSKEFLKLQTYCGVFNLMKHDIRSSSTDDTLLHLCVSRLNMVKHGFFADNSSPKVSN